MPDTSSRDEWEPPYGVRIEEDGTICVENWETTGRVVKKRPSSREATVRGALSSEQDQPSIHRAYRDLLGNAYEQFQTEHIALTSVQQVSGPDFEAAWTWQRLAVENRLSELLPNSYVALLVTDQGSAVIPPPTWYESPPPISKRIAGFVAAVNATWLIVTYASGSGRKIEDIMLEGTDGHTARRTHWAVEFKSFGKRKVRQDSAELRPWDDSFWLSNAAFELRENRERASSAMD